MDTYTVCLCADSASHVTEAAVQAAIGTLQDSMISVPVAEVIQAFEVPKHRYDPVRQRFYRVQGTPALHGSAKVSNNCSVPANYLITRVPSIADDDQHAPAQTAAQTYHAHECHVLTSKSQQPVICHASHN